MIFTPMTKKYSRCMYLLAVLSAFWLSATVEGHNNNASNDPLLLYSTFKDIRIVNTTRNSHNKIGAPTILVANLTDSAAIDFIYEQKKICWADHGLESIRCLTYNGVEAENKVEVISGGVLSPVGLTCDWFTNKLYWTDSDTNRLEVATMEGLYRKVLFWTDIDQPRAIALAPMKGLMFWTDWGEIPKIERAGMNGDPATRKIIVSEKIFWPNGLAIDYKSDLIYWVDGKLKFIEVMNFDGTNRTTVLAEHFEYPFAVTFFKTKLFWTDWKTWSIHTYDLRTTDVKELIHHDVNSVPMDIRVYDKDRQPYHSHPCEKNNGGCSHLCLLSPDPPGYSCACPIGIKLMTNLTCADGPQELLVLARRTDICLVHLDSPDYTHKVLPLRDVKFAISVDYDPVDGYIYWSDDQVKKIQRAKLDGSDQQDVVTTEIKHPDGIAVDWVSRNVYWIDAGNDHVEVSRLNGKHRRVIISENLIKPRAIAVAPELGWLFWSDWYEANPKVERSNLDGSERLVIVSKDLVWPNGITLDLANTRIYWCDAKLDKIEYANMDGTERRVLINDDIPHVFGFSLMGDYLYWTDWQLRTIDRAHKDTGRNREIIADQIPDVMGLKAIKLKQVSGWNPCSDNNGNCSQFCFYRHNKTRVCKCQLGYELMRDRRTCVQPDTFLLYTKQNKIGTIGIENEDNEATVPVSKVKHASSIDFDVNTMRIYWTDSKQRTVMRSFLNGSDPEKVVELGLASPEGLAVDWLGLNVYWTDALAHRIEVARLVGTSRRTLLWEGKVYDPHGIVLDPPAGYMYWSEWGSSNAIRKASMDGSNPVKLVSTNGHAADLTLDYERKRLYWSETDTPAILSSDLNGNDKKTIVKDHDGGFRPIGLTLCKQFLYWSDGRTGQIMKADKVTGTQRARVQQMTDPPVTDLVAFHAKPKGSNQCAISNGGCSHLCLALPATEVPEETVKYTCACPTHYTLIGNECIPPKQFMIYSQKNLTVRLLPSPTGCPEAVLPIQGLRAVRAIDFDPLYNVLYWIEGKSQSIKRAEATTGTQLSTVVNGNDGSVQPYDLAIDSLGRLLFWTCAAQNVVNVTRLDNTVPFGVVVQREKEKPRLLMIHPTKRLLFYTDVGSSPQLIRTRLDGSHRLVIAKASDIQAIAVDPENDLVVWAQSHSIHMSNIDGENQHVLLNESTSRISQLTIHSGWLYWIDREFSQLQRQELISGNSGSPLSVQATHLVDIVSVTELNYNHSCGYLHHKKCSHLCILNGTVPTCACPKGNVLKDDKRTCSPVLDCGPERFTCSLVPADEKDCIPISWRCDKQNDCKDGSDEIDCPDCQPDQFKCLDGHCINQQQVCDGIPNCLDKSDEVNCCKDGFQCPNTQVCLGMDLVCDKVDHCADGADEHQSLCNNVNNASSKLKGTSDSMTVIIIFGIIFALAFAGGIFYCLIKRCAGGSAGIPSPTEIHDQSEDSLSPMQPKPFIKPYYHHQQQQQKNNRKGGGGIPDVIRMSMLNGDPDVDGVVAMGDSSDLSSYDRNHITGASRSNSTNTNGGGGGGSSSANSAYPRETLNPPPSPATTAASTRGSSPSSRYRPYRHYRVINQPPPPSLCSTDVNDESDYNYPTNNRHHHHQRYHEGSLSGGGGGGAGGSAAQPFVPPPTPSRSYCTTHNSESCPPSPSSRSSTYFSPLPPPPSPVMTSAPPLMSHQCHRGGGGTGGHGTADEYDS